MVLTFWKRSALVFFVTLCAMLLALGLMFSQQTLASETIEYEVYSGADGKTLVKSGSGSAGDVVSLPTPANETWNNNGVTVTATFIGWHVAGCSSSGDYDGLTISCGKECDDVHKYAYYPTQPYRLDHLQSGNGFDDMSFEPALLTGSSFALAADRKSYEVHAYYMVEPCLVDLTLFRDGTSLGSGSRVVVVPGDSVPASEFENTKKSFDESYIAATTTFDAWRSVTGSGKYASIQEVFDTSTPIASSMTIACNRVTKTDSPAPGYMYRLYNPNSGEHFYTSDTAEHDNLVSAGWADENKGWTAPTSSNTPVFRMYNPNAGEHHYCIDVAEKNMLIDAGWNYEGVGWFSDDAESIPLYRDYNPNAFSNNHNYTTSKDEHDWLVSLGWQSEGFAWYGVQ